MFTFIAGGIITSALATLGALVALSRETKPRPNARPPFYKTARG